MAVWALADLHLAFGTPEKKMDVFGEPWINYTEKIKKNWLNCIQPSDLVLLPGDISWAIQLEDAVIDLKWIHELPGTKVMIKGNHDYWWRSLTKIEKILPPSIHLIQNNAFHWEGYSIGGSRLWDSSAYNFNAYIEFKENPYAKILLEKSDKVAESEKIFQRELQRLESSLKNLNPQASIRIAMTHYPPISADLKDSAVSQLLEKYHVNTCLFGHLHNVKKHLPLFGEKNQIRYILTSGDYLDFMPKLIYS
ncbi:metallophosphoesterase [Neochlamydia sp. EPS4]|uniref:metallophosphoesterase n=1 Tax=Neochlamydia sp. EPS4 TaxID=1478175 RepID=UPI0005D12020|nr:metallophosphoesterase [Neochlamydia sp. EPS4]